MSDKISFKSEKNTDVDFLAKEQFKVSKVLDFLAKGLLQQAENIAFQMGNSPQKFDLIGKIGICYLEKEDTGPVSNLFNYLKKRQGIAKVQKLDGKETLDLIPSEKKESSDCNEFMQRAGEYLRSKNYLG